MFTLCDKIYLPSTGTPFSSKSNKITIDEMNFLLQDDYHSNDGDDDEKLCLRCN